MLKEDIFINLKKCGSGNKLFKAYKLFFGTLASKNRLLIINLLRKKPQKVSEIQEKLSISQTRASHSLRRLRRCGFVNVKKEGRFRIYSLNSKTITPLMKLIDKHMKEYCIRIVSKQNKRC